jgi:site-specific recombinase
MLDWFKGSDLHSKKKFHEIELKNAELEMKLLQNNVELEQIKNHLRDTQVSLQLVLSSYQGLAEEVSTLYDALRAMMAPSNKHAFKFSFRQSKNDDDDSWN